MFVDRAASRHICVIKTNLMHYLPSVYFANQPLHVSGISVAHHQEVYCIYTTNRYLLCFSVDCLLAGPRDSQLQICPKHAEVD